MVFSETELGPWREVISRYFHGHACACKETVHFDGIRVTTHWHERRDDYQVSLLNPDSSVLAVYDRDPLPRPHAHPKSQ
jgi:hypothetical protein